MKRRLQKTRKISAKMEGLSEVRPRKDKGRRIVEGKGHEQRITEENNSAQ